MRSEWGNLDNSKHFIFWLCNIKQLSFRHFNTNSKKVFEIVFFFPETKQNGSKKANILQLLEKLCQAGVLKPGFSKHFVIFLNFSCLIACLVCCLIKSFFLLVLWLGICAEVDVDRITILPPSLPPSLCFFFVSTKILFNTSDSYLKSVRA